MKIKKEVRKCDRCDSLFEIWWDSNTSNGPDYRVTYLGKEMDLCSSCYGNFTRAIQHISIARNVGRFATNK